MLNILKRWSNFGKDGFNVKNLFFDTKETYQTNIHIALPSHVKKTIYVIDAGDRRVEIAGSKTISIDLKDPFIMYKILTNIKLKCGNVKYDFAIVHQTHHEWFCKNFDFKRKNN